MEELSDMRFMVFDVESVGLHGEGFAVGYIVVDGTGQVHEEGYASCPMEAAAGGTSTDRDWVRKHVVPALPSAHKFETPKQVREFFWRAWDRWSADGETKLYAECGWPVEARFLIACVDDDRPNRNWTGPYPLHEVASFLNAVGIMKLDHPRLPNELPRHNPLADARQSARLLLVAIQEHREKMAP